MPAFAVYFTPAADKALRRLPRDVRALIVGKVEALARDPDHAANVKKLAGMPGYRLRVGDWRVIYELDRGRLIVRVLRIGARGGVYG